MQQEGEALKNRKKIIGALTLTLAVGSALGGFCLTTGNCQPPERQAPVAKPANRPATTQEIKWHTSLDEAIQRATTEDKLIFVDFNASWCPPCKLMEQETFTNEKFIFAAQDFVLAKIDVDENPDTAAKYGVEGLPTLGILHPDGKPVAGVSGFHSASELQQLMQAARAQADKE